MNARARFMPWVWGLLAVSLAISLFFARTGARAECLSHRDCQANERCVVIPKGDGFATFGRCGELCEDDSACADGWTCRGWVEEGSQGYLGSERGKAPELPRVKVCQHHTVQ